MSKGSKQRPSSVDRKTFETNFDRIFGETVQCPQPIVNKADRLLAKSIALGMRYGSSKIKG